MSVPKTIFQRDGLRVLVASAVLAIAGVSSGCAEEEGCTLVGCSDVAALDVISVDDPGLLDGATLELCIRDRCASSVLPQVIENGTNTGGVQGELPLRVDVCDVAGGLTKVYARVLQAEGLADGDIYSLSLTANDGTFLVGKTWTATYTERYPNGRHCNRCMYAELTPAM